jgi:hypothetical protein
MHRQACRALMNPIAPRTLERFRLHVHTLGFGRLPTKLNPVVLRELQDEADASFGAASAAEQDVGLLYRARIAPLGPRATAFLSGLSMRAVLNDVFHERFELTSRRSCLTYYLEGDHLGPHRDEPADECAVTIIVCLKAIGPADRSPGTGLVLRVLGNGPSGDVEPRLMISTRSGDIVVGCGSEFWHERPRLQAGESVAVLTGCYAGPASHCAQSAR